MKNLLLQQRAVNWRPGEHVDMSLWSCIVDHEGRPQECRPKGLWGLEILHSACSIQWQENPFHDDPTSTVDNSRSSPHGRKFQVQTVSAGSVAVIWRIIRAS